MENNLFISQDNLELLERGVIFKYLHASFGDPYRWVFLVEKEKYESNFDAVLSWYL